MLIVRGRAHRCPPPLGLKKTLIKEAKEKFEEAVKYLDKFENKSNENEREGCQLYQSVLTNLCNCCNKLQEYYKLISHAN